MAEDNLKLNAELVDKVTGPLRNIAKELEKFAKAESQAHREGSRRSTDHTNKLWLLRREWVALAGNMRSVVSPALSELSIGLGGIGVSAAGIGIAVAAAISAVKDFAKTSTSLINVSNQTKFFKDQVLQWQIAGEGMGLSIGQVNESLKSFSALMDQTNRRSVFGFQRWMEMPGLREMLGGDQFTRMKDRMAQARHAIDVINKNIPDADKRRRALSILGLPEELAGFTKDQIDRFFDSAKAAVDNNKDKIDWEKGFDANIAFNRISSELGLLKQRVANRIVDVFDTAHDYKKNMEDFLSGKSFRTPESYVTKENTLSPLSLLRSGKTYLGRFRDWMNSQTPAGTAPGAGEFPGSDELEKALKSPRRSGTSGQALRSAIGLSDIRDFEGAVERGTQRGVVSGLREYYATAAAGTDISQGTTGGVSRPIGRMGGGMIGERPGFGGFRPYPGGRTGGGGGRSDSLEGGGGGGPEPATQPGLAADRARYARELTPQMVDRIKQISAGENTNSTANLAVLETVFNRAGSRKQSLGQVTQQYTGPGSPGYYPGSTFSGGSSNYNNNSRIRAMVDNNWRKVLAGSNVSDYATDNSSGGLAVRDQSTGAFRLHHKYNGESFFSPGNRGRGRQSRTSYEEWLARVTAPQPPKSNTGYFRRGIPMHRDGSEKKSLLEGAKEAGVVGRVEGSASLDITLNGFPRGTHTRMSSEGLLKEVKLNRGTQMVRASEDG